MIKDKLIKNMFISVIITAYKSAKTVNRAIQSVIKQTYQNFECIVVDDASADDTQNVVNQIQDPRIRYVRLDKNRGVAAARNEGIKLAHGGYIALLDSDDEYLPERIEENLKAISSCGREVGLICSNFWTVNERSDARNIAQEGHIDALWHIPSPSTWLLPKEVFDAIGLFDELFRVDEDRDFLFRFQKEFKLFYIEKPLVVRYKLKGRLSSQVEKYVVARKIFLQKHEKILKGKRKYLAYHFYRLGKDLISLGLKKEGKEYFLKAFLAYPLQMEYFLKIF